MDQKARTHTTHHGPNLGERLARLRAARGLSQQALATQAGLHVSTVTRLEAHESWDTVQWRIVREVAKALEMRVEDLAS